MSAVVFVLVAMATKATILIMAMYREISYTVCATILNGRYIPVTMATMPDTYTMVRGLVCVCMSNWSMIHYVRYRLITHTHGGNEWLICIHRYGRTGMEANGINSEVFG